MYINRGHYLNEAITNNNAPTREYHIAKQESFTGYIRELRVYEFDSANIGY